ncbi:MAG: sigma-70 family RNA polymerase sigma factor [Myxococcota bacterium]|nr:sigma-70 family RNA polymerase sigma factor [Myxococcota bacterium]
MRNIDETELIQKCTAGEEAAWRELVRRFEGVVYAVSYRILKDRDEARDATQESLIRAMRALDTFQQGKQLRPWMCRIALNHALRLAVKRHKQLISLDERGPADVWSPLPDPAQITERWEVEQALHQAMETLPSAQQMVMELRLGQGMDYREIAEATGWPIGTVKTNLFRARQRLIEQLAALDRDEE